MAKRGNAAHSRRQLNLSAMSAFIFFNGKIQPAEAAQLSAISCAALYGRGIFTTVVIHRATAFLWEKHWRRLITDAQKVGVALGGFSETETLRALYAVIEKNDLRGGRARVTFYDETPSRIWQNDAREKTNLLIQTAEFRPIIEPFRLTVSPHRINSTSPLAGVKSCNYLENILAIEEAKARNYDEAMRLNERGEIVAACMANVFWMKNGKLYTPSLETGCLNGTTRQFVLENFRVTETKASLRELKKADEIFLSSAGIGIVRGELRFGGSY